MCGIIGEISQNEIDSSHFKSMLNTLSHRGPDGEGIEYLYENRVALGHRRLSIIDLTEKGKQPMTNEDNSVWLTFNGEIYNFQQLKKELNAAGHQFKSTSDSEVLVHGYEHWGIDVLLDKISGMFAFAIWDEKLGKLFLARDRFGIKPLYYYHNSSHFIFSSELKAIHASKNVNLELDFSSVFDYFVYRYVPSPKSIYKHTYKLPPAHYLTFDPKSSDLKIYRYWELETAEDISNQDDINGTVKQLLNESINSHLVSDVPVGVLLSGGYDSSALVQFMSQMSYPISTYTIGFEKWSKSEHEFARLIAQKYNTDHHEHLIKDVVPENFDHLMYHYDEPLGGTSFLPTFKVSELASKHVKVVLGGDGGDEIFAGYKWHYKISESLSSPFNRIKNLKSDWLLRQYFSQMSWSGFNYKEVNRLFHNVLNGKDVPDDLWLYRKYDNSKLPPIKRLQLLDISTFLPEVVLTKVDRASMSQSLEVRVPYLDHRIAEYFFHLQSDLYYDSSVKKKLLFDQIKDNLPAEILSKPKQGFGAPAANSEIVSEYFRNINKLKIVEHKLVDATIISDYVNRNQAPKLWAIFLFDNWYKKWLV